MQQKGWDAYYEKHQATEFPADAELMQEIRDLTPGRALDLGCGSGADALALAALGWQVTAVDFSAAAIASLKARAKDADLEINAKVGNILELEEAARYDLIYCCHIHLPAPERQKLFSHLGDLLLPGGRLLYIGLTGIDFPGAEADLFAPATVVADLMAGLRVEKSETRSRSIDTGEAEITAQGVVIRARCKMQSL